MTLMCITGKALNKAVMAAVEAALQQRFGTHAGWAHNTLFISELVSQRHRLPPQLVPRNAKSAEANTPPVPAIVASKHSADRAAGAASTPSTKRRRKMPDGQAQASNPAIHSTSKVLKTGVRRSRRSLASQQGLDPPLPDLQECSPTQPSRGAAKQSKGRTAARLASHITAAVLGAKAAAGDPDSPSVKDNVLLKREATCNVESSYMHLACSFLSFITSLCKEACCSTNKRSCFLQKLSLLARPHLKCAHQLCTTQA